MTTIRTSPCGWRKDVDLAVAVGREFDVPMKLANTTLPEMTEAMNYGWAGRDSRVAMLLQEERAGIEVEIDPDDLLRSRSRAGENAW